MEVTDNFKKTIKDFLKVHTFKNPDYAKNIMNPKKNIEDCITYILNTVKNSKRVGFTDDEIYGLALHYYDEDEIDIGGKIDISQVVVNYVPKLSEKEKEELREKARQEVIQEEKDKMRGKTSEKSKEKKADVKPATTGTLF